MGDPAARRATYEDLLAVPDHLVAEIVPIVGALVALLPTDMPLNASSLMGCVLLVGLVVKNGVLLLEEAERSVDSGETAEDGVAHASERRLRPIVMTTPRWRRSPVSRRSRSGSARGPSSNAH